MGKKVIKSNKDSTNYESLLKMFKNSTIPDNEKLYHLGLFIKRQPMSRFLFMYEIYKRIVNIHGVIFEFGVRWGQDLVWYENFRGIFEPYNYNRKITYLRISVTDRCDLRCAYCMKEKMIFLPKKDNFSFMRLWRNISICGERYNPWNELKTHPMGGGRHLAPP